MSGFTRREFLFACAALPRLIPTRLAICSETFLPLGFAEACRLARRIGYAGIEIQPSHLAPEPLRLAKPQRREVRFVLDGEGLACPAFHNLLAGVAGLHLTTPQGAVRVKSWQYLGGLVELAAEISPGAALVLGSGRQRSAVEGATREEATARLAEGLAGLALRAEKAGVLVLVEPLAPHLSNVVNTLAEAVSIVRSVGSPAVQTMFDTHNTAAETEEPDRLIERYRAWIRHVHLNEWDGSAPGRGDYPFATVLGALRRTGYAGWLSVEVFDFRPDGETVAREALQYLTRLAARASAGCHPAV